MGQLRKKYIGSLFLGQNPLKNHISNTQGIYTEIHYRAQKPGLQNLWNHAHNPYQVHLRSQYHNRIIAWPKPKYTRINWNPEFLDFKTYETGSINPSGLALIVMSLSQWPWHQGSLIKSGPLIYSLTEWSIFHIDVTMALCIGDHLSPDRWLNLDRWSLFPIWRLSHDNTLAHCFITYHIYNG